MSLKPPVGPQDHVQGNPDAPIELVEYGDFECPFCGQAYDSVKAVQAALGDDLRFVFRNFPLAQAHPHALAAAQAAEAAGLQGRFWEMHDVLFEHQDMLDEANLLRFAAALRSGVNGTPTFFVNGERYDGSWAPQDFVAALSSLAPDVAVRP